MKNKNLLLVSLVLVFIISLNSCSSNTTAGGQVNPNSVGTPFTLKYEIITSSPVSGNPSFTYQNGTQQPETDTSFTTGTYWSKELTVTTLNRPFKAILMCFAVSILAPGTITGNIYVNGNLVAHSINQTQLVSGINISPVSMLHDIQ